VAGTTGVAETREKKCSLWPPANRFIHSIDPIGREIVGNEWVDHASAVGIRQELKLT
jgi:hypothetical protein